MRLGLLIVVPFSYIFGYSGVLFLRVFEPEGSKYIITNLKHMTMKVQVLYFDREVARVDTLEFDILRLTNNSLICKAHGSFLNYLVSDKDAETFFIHRNVFNSLTNNSICQIVEKPFGVGGKSIWLATFKTM